MGVCYHKAVTDFQPDTYGESFADVYDDWYRGITDAEATATFVSARVGPGPVLELGVGSGRLAKPLAERGLRVLGIDASSSMLDRCRVAVPGIPLVRADLAQLPIGGSIGGALCAFNTIFNLPTAAAQGQLFAGLASVLDSRGAVIVEAITGASLGEGPATSVGVSRMTTDRVVLSATVLDAGAQQIRGQHIDISERGIRLRPWLLRWSTPDQLDELANAAGLHLTERYGGWHEESFHPESDTHISVYQHR